MKEIDPKDYQIKPFSHIGDDWMLITSVKKDGSQNTMTASWGGIGVLFGKNVCFIFVRPSRYTDEFIKDSNAFSLSFYGDNFKNNLSYLGSHSGRNTDKIKELRLKTVKDGEFAYFDGAREVIFAKNLYSAPLDFTSIISDDVKKMYEKGDIHCMYIAEIVKILL